MNPLSKLSAVLAVPVLFTTVSLEHVGPFSPGAAETSGSRVGIAHKNSIHAIYFDFDDDDGNFTSGGGGSWMWVPAPSSADMVNNVWKTGGLDNYPDNDCSWLDSPMITIVDEFSLMIFQHQSEIQPFEDGGNVQISIDGGLTFDLLFPWNGYSFPPPFNVFCPEGLNGEVYSDFSAGYEKTFFRLGDYVGQQVIIRWVFESDPVVNFPGWTIDKIRVIGAELI